MYRVVLPIVSGLVLAAAPAFAAELEPRAYVNTPPEINFLIAGYVYSEGGLSTAAAPKKDATFRFIPESSTTHEPWMCSACPGSSTT